jgi:hypothetical protein
MNLWKLCIAIKSLQQLLRRLGCIAKGGVPAWFA